MRRAAALVAALAAAAWAPGCGPGEAPAEDRGAPAEDPRLAWLLDYGGRDDHYDVDTSDPVGILGQVLRKGQREPLRRARIELTDLGPQGVAAAERLIDAAWNDPMRFADIRNALDALSYSTSDEAHRVVARVLEHPDPTPRQAAWRSLKPMARPEDFDRIHTLLEHEDPLRAPELAQLLFVADPERAVSLYLDWIEEERRPELWNEIANALPKTRDPDNALRACRLRRGRDPILELQLTGACVVSGDAQALEDLRAKLRDELPGAREIAVNALVSAGHAEEVEWTMRNDPLASLRALAATHVIAEWPPEAAEELLLAGLADADATVSWTCLNALVERGNAEAIERALGRLGSQESGVLELSILALRPRMLRDQALAERAFALLERRAQDEDWLDLGLRKPTLRAIGLTPCRASAELLVETSRGAVGHVQGVHAERWILQQVGNAGPAGQRVLIEELARETDLHRRLDLIEALAATPSELSSTWLLERAAAEDVDPWELLFVAERLTRVGPTARVAPVLKRSVLRVQQGDVRRALQALLWVWYPAPAR